MRFHIFKHVSKQSKENRVD